MPDQQNSPDSRPKRNIIRTKAVEQHDQEIADKKVRQETKTKKNNIKAQREAMNTHDDDPAPPARATDRAIVEIPMSRKKQSASAHNKSLDAEIEDTPAPKRQAPVKNSQARTNNDTKSKSHAGSQSQTQTKTRNGSPTTKNKEVPARAKSKGGPDPTQRYKLIADIAKRDQQFDHTEFDMKTLQLIWNNGKKVERDEPSVPKGNRYKEISVLGTMDIDDDLSSRTASRKDKRGPKIAPPVDFARARRISSVSSTSSVRSMTPVPMSRQSTPAAALQVPSKAFRPTPVASGPRAMSGYSTSRSASPFDRSADFASDFDESFVEEIEAVTVSCPKKENKKPKRSNYTGTVLEIVDATYEEVVARLVTESFFPGRTDFDDIVTEAWKRCAKQIGVDPSSPRYKIDEGHRKVTKYRISSFQGRVKDAIMAHIEDGLKLLGSESHIRTEVAKLLPHGFHKKPGSGEGKGQYQHPFVQTALNYSFFDMKPKSTPIGVTYSSYFNGHDGMPLPAVALSCAVTHWCVEQFKTGTKNQEAQMQTTVIQKYYEVHLDNLRLFEKINPDLADVMRKKWYISAVSHAKAPPPKANKIKPVEDLSACLILPDKPTRQEREAVSGALKRLHQRSRGHDVKADPDASGDAEEPDSDLPDEPDDFEDDDRHNPRKTQKASRPAPRRVTGWGEESEEEKAEVDHEDDGEGEHDDSDGYDAGGDGEGGDGEDEDEGEGKGEYEAAGEGGGEGEGEGECEGGNGSEGEETGGYVARVTRSSPSKPRPGLRNTKGGPAPTTHTGNEELGLARPPQLSPVKSHKRRHSGMDEQPGSEEDGASVKPMRKKGKGGRM